jgi:hypothetical protein
LRRCFTGGSIGGEGGELGGKAGAGETIWRAGILDLNIPQNNYSVYLDCPERL